MAFNLLISESFFSTTSFNLLFSCTTSFNLLFSWNEEKILKFTLSQSYMLLPFEMFLEHSVRIIKYFYFFLSILEKKKVGILTSISESILKFCKNALMQLWICIHNALDEMSILDLTLEIVCWLRFHLPPSIWWFLLSVCSFQYQNKSWSHC